MDLHDGGRHAGSLRRGRPLIRAYNEGANWVGVLFGAYNGFAALAAVVIPIVAARVGLRVSPPDQSVPRRRRADLVPLHHDPTWLLLAMVGVGFAWASILSVPYALLSNGVPAQKMGLYMGIFNFFIVIPQLVAASVLGFLLKQAVRRCADLRAGARRRELHARRVAGPARAAPGARRAIAFRPARR